MERSVTGDEVVPAAEIIKTIDRRWPLEPLEANYSAEVANRYRYRDGAGEIGIVASVTQPFCGGCSRARLSAEGKLYTCLFAARGHDLRRVLRDRATNQELARQLQSIWTRRVDRYSDLRHAETPQHNKIEMSYIGG